MVSIGVHFPGISGDLQIPQPTYLWIICIKRSLASSTYPIHELLYSYFNNPLSVSFKAPLGH